MRSRLSAAVPVPWPVPTVAAIWPVAAGASAGLPRPDPAGDERREDQASRRPPTNAKRSGRRKAASAAHADGSRSGSLWRIRCHTSSPY